MIGILHSHAEQYILFAVLVLRGFSYLSLSFLMPVMMSIPWTYAKISYHSNPWIKCSMELFYNHISIHISLICKRQLIPPGRAAAAKWQTTVSDLFKYIYVQNTRTSYSWRVTYKLVNNTLHPSQVSAPKWTPLATSLHTIHICWPSLIWTCIGRTDHQT